MSQVKLKRSKCSAIIVSVLAPHFLYNFVNDIKINPYGLILHESTNILKCKEIVGVSGKFTNFKQKNRKVYFLRTSRIKMRNNATSDKYL